MADIFLSYSREDRARVEPLLEALTLAGYSVWWDKNLAGGTRYLNETEAELNAAKAVLVVWSKTSVGSHWVADEAGAGRDSGRLVPITLDGTMAPLGFRQFQVLDFSKWKRGDEAQFSELCAALARLIDKPVEGRAPVAISKPPAGLSIARRTLMIGGVVAPGVALIAGVAFLATGRQPETAAPRLAFFGFTASDSEPAHTAIADRATTEVFEALSSQQVNMASRNETAGVAADQQTARAEALGARFSLSGAIAPEPGRPDHVNVAIRLDDAKTRTTLWQDSIVANAAEPLPAAVQAATRAGDTALCVIRHYPRLSRSIADADLLTPLATYCGGRRGASTPESNRALRRLVELAPDNGDLLANLAWVLQSEAFEAGSLSADSTLVTQSEQIAQRAEALDPDSFYLTMAQYGLSAIHGRPLADREMILRSRLQRSSANDVEQFGYQMVNGYLGRSLNSVGRFGAAVPYSRMGTQADPFSFPRRFDNAETLAYTNKPEAWDAIEQAFARSPWPPRARDLLFAGAVLYGAGDPDALLASPPKSVPVQEVACWRDVNAALQSSNSTRRVEGLERVRACGRAGLLSANPAFLALAQLGDLDSAFASVENPAFGIFMSREIINTHSLFLPPTRAMRADPRFLPLMEKLGLMDYWRTTNSAPDVCATENAPFCLALKEATGNR